ncbi:hypothetical protein [Pectobacterium brasiliense]|uniref:hypothetical protein n=1 Tax=Pectobacterium brasiliense TaxID=180957 RepID=UPI0019D3690D|nr:hypothetical protein [Pectobacterium brasiliense]MBN7767488.1 hypothetical protein [Pectobacterium brasiliense]
MGIYTNVEVVKGIENTHQVIYREISGDRVFDINNLNTDESKDDFLKSVLWATWRMFYDLVTVRPHVLDKNTGFNQEYMSNKIHFVLSDYIDSKPEFLSNLLRVLYEYFFWTGRERSHSFLSYEVLTALHDNFGKNDNLSLQFQWIRDDLSVALTQWILTGDEFSSAKRLIIDVESAKRDMISDVTTKLLIFRNDMNKETEASLNLISQKYNDVQSDIKNKERNVVDSVENINNKLNEVKKLEEKITNLRSEYNFVGLSSGFDRIKEKKMSN